MKARGLQFYRLLCILTGMLLLWSADAAAAGTVDLTVDKTSLDVGDSLQVLVLASEPSDEAVPVEVTLTYNAELLEFTYCSAQYGGGEGGLVTFRGTSASLGFKAKRAGTAFVHAEAVIDGDANEKAAASQSVSISGGAESDGEEGTAEATLQTQSSEELSSNTYLKKFKVKNAKLSPKFSKSVTDYTVTLTEESQQLAYTAQTDDANAQIIAVSGFANLKNGTNKAVLTVMAQDGTTMPYTFTIIKEGEAASQSDLQERERAEVNGGRIPIADSDLYVNTSFPEEFLPKGFIKADYVYKEQYVEAAHFEMGDLMLLYLSSFDGGDADFYIYYSGTDEFLDFIQLKGSEGNFLCPVRVPVGVVIPDGFRDAAMEWNGKTALAYVTAQAADGDAEETDESGTGRESGGDAAAGTSQDAAEETAQETEQGADDAQDGAQQEEIAPGNIPADPEDFYLLYAINQSGEEGFYLYDSKEETYQRFLQLASDSGGAVFDEENYVIYKAKSQHRMVVIGVLIVLTVLMAFVILNMYLHMRDLQGGELPDDAGTQGRPTDAGGQNGGLVQRVKAWLEELRAQSGKRKQEREKLRQEKERQREERQQDLLRQKQEMEQAEAEKKKQERLEWEQKQKEKEQKQKEKEQKQKEQKQKEQRQQELREQKEQQQKEIKQQEQQRRPQEQEKAQPPQQAPERTVKDPVVKKRRTERERQREEALRRINRRAEAQRETRKAGDAAKGASAGARANRSKGPVMFDLTMPKIDDNLTPKMQREQVDDDFEFEFINIDED